MYTLHARIALVFIVLSIGIFPDAFSQYSGLQFKGHTVPLDQRTSLELTPDKPIRVDKNFRLAFDLKFVPGRISYFGYIFRAIIDDENYDFIFSPQNNGQKNLHLVVGEEISNISFYVPEEKLSEQWNKVEIKFESAAGLMQLKFNDIIYTDTLQLQLKKSKMRLFFGAHNYGNYISTDLPDMNVRSIQMYDERNLVHHWPLDHYSGERVEDIESSNDGMVENPVWIVGLHVNWKKHTSVTFKGRITQIYDNSSDELVVMTDDSLLRYHVGTNKFVGKKPNRYGAPNPDFHLAIDPGTSQLFYYSIDQNKKINLSDSLEYTGDYIERQPFPHFWHHNKIVNPLNHDLFTFGGYGWFNYLNAVLRYDDGNDRWDTIAYAGTYHPRYLAGLGYSERNNMAYILGGYGSVSGQQEINPGYYYDLITYSFEDNKFETLTKFDDQKGAFCFSNTLHLDTADNVIYGLKYSKFEAKPELQAVAVSLDDFRIGFPGDSFEFNFLDINSTIDLYYSAFAKKLLAVTTYFENDETAVNIHTISYPPLNLDSVHTDVVQSKNRWVKFVILLFVIIFSGMIWFFWRKRNRSALSDSIQTKDYVDNQIEDLNLHDTEKPNMAHEHIIRPSSVLIFGGFQVINKEGNNITGQFTPLLKELFMYILLNSLRYDQGVAPGKLNELFWLDKSEKAARNNRAVNITKLRSLLENVGECSISKETGTWKFDYSPGKVYIDYGAYLQLAGRSNHWTKEEIIDLLKIIQNGPPLSNISADWLDEFKGEISNEIIDGILEYIKRNKQKKEHEFNIQLTNAIFHFDIANEEAMIIKCKTLVDLGKHSLAKNAYAKFKKEYNILYGEDYSLTFKQVLEHD